MRWLLVRDEPCPYCAVWMGPHEHSLRDDGTLGVLVRPVVPTVQESQRCPTCWSDNPALNEAQDESSVWFNKRAAAEGRAAKERSGRLAAEARLAEVEQALRDVLTLATCADGHPEGQAAWRHASARALAVLAKGEQTDG